MYVYMYIYAFKILSLLFYIHIIGKLLYLITKG